MQKGFTMANSNLKSLGDRPEAERKAIASAGGKASGESRRRSKELKAVISNYLYQECELSMGSSFDIFGDETPRFHVKKQDPKTVLDAIALTVVEKALDGDMRAISIVTSAIGME